MKIKRILLDVDGKEEPIDITDLQQEDYEEFLELMQKLYIGYYSILNKKNIKKWEH